MEEGTCLAGQVVVKYGVSMTVAAIPDAEIRALWGYGHFPGHGRAVVRIPGRNWPWTPGTCSPDACSTEWIDDGRVLVCTGCGLDVT